MAHFANVTNGVVKHIHSLDEANMIHQKWIALFRSNVLIKDSTGYDVMPGDLFVDGKFYKKDLETGEAILLQEGEWVHPKAIRFAGIMDGEIVGQWGQGKELFKDEEEMNQFVEDILNSEIVEINYDPPQTVKVNWLYDGVNFIQPESN